jgi:DNA-3-methyladenine glycosylase I
VSSETSWKSRTVVRHADGKLRCAWCGTDPLYVRYHDEEWGVPLHDERGLFEMLCLEGAQAGLSWITILRKRENYRRAFDGFDIGKIARYKAPQVARLMKDAGIVRNRLKVQAFIANAQATLALRAEGGSLDELLWSFAPKKRRARWKTLGELPASTAESDAMSKALKKRGFKFVGTTICYAFMQAVGIVDDHQSRCSSITKASGT